MGEGRRRRKGRRKGREKGKRVACGEDTKTGKRQNSRQI